jgi:hypothetical protein
MRIQIVMEVSDTFVRAYEYYKQLLKKKDEHTTDDYVLGRVAQMFGLNNRKKFKDYVMHKEKEERDFLTDRR